MTASHCDCHQCRRLLFDEVATRGEGARYNLEGEHHPRMLARSLANVFATSSIASACDSPMNGALTDPDHPLYIVGPSKMKRLKRGDMLWQGMKSWQYLDLAVSKKAAQLGGLNRAQSMRVMSVTEEHVLQRSHRLFMQCEERIKLMTRYNRLMFEPSAYLDVAPPAPKKDYLDWLEEDLEQTSEDMGTMMLR